MWIRKFLAIAPCLWSLASACGNDPTETTGALELTISTVGHDLDPNGYMLTIDGGAPTAVPANGTVTHEELPPGAHALSLAGLDENCALQEPIPFQFSVTAGVPTKIDLHITCDFANTLAFTLGGKLYITSADAGAVPRQIGEGFSDISWSRDGSTLATVGSRRVSLADADGGNVRVLYEVPSGVIGFHFGPRVVWSPDGTSLFLNYGTTHTRFLASLSTIHPGELEYPPGLDSHPLCQTTLSLRAAVPSWSPDSRHFVVNGQGGGHVVCTFSAASDFERVLAPGDYPDWSPDGSRIAFEADELSDSSIHTIAPDGSDERDLLPSPSAGALERWPAWSPDGGELSFVVPLETDVFTHELWVMDALGGNRRRLVPQVQSHGRQVPWSRDGQRLAFKLSSGQLAVINRDGSGFLPVTPVGEEVTSWAWRP